MENVHIVLEKLGDTTWEEANQEGGAAVSSAWMPTALWRSGQGNRVGFLLPSPDKTWLILLVENLLQQQHPMRLLLLDLGEEPRLVVTSQGFNLHIQLQLQPVTGGWWWPPCHCSSGRGCRTSLTSCGKGEHKREHGVEHTASLLIQWAAAGVCQDSALTALQSLSLWDLSPQQLPRGPGGAGCKGKGSHIWPGETLGTGIPGI
jgi:hypothetical protein